MSDFTIADGTMNVKITGLRETLRSMEKAGTGAQDLKDLMTSLSAIVISAAQPPRDSGQLSATVRPGRGKTKAVIRAGGARTPYAGVVHYGWPARGIAAQPFLADAITRTRPQILAQLDKGLQDLLRDNDLT